MPSSKRSKSSKQLKPAWREYEKLAGNFFEQQGYKILARNWRAGRLEIDLIVQLDDLIVFVEVKSAASKKFGHPVERIDEKKIMLIQFNADIFIIKY